MESNGNGQSHSKNGSGQTNDESGDALREVMDSNRGIDVSFAGRTALKQTTETYIKLKRSHLRGLDGCYFHRHLYM